MRPAAREPTGLELWVSDGGWLVELLLPRTDAGVGAQAVLALAAFALLAGPARRARLLPLWCGVLLFTAGLFGLRSLH